MPFSCHALIDYHNCDYGNYCVMVPLPRQCPGVSGKVCNCFQPAEDNDPHRLCTLCRDKTCDVEIVTTGQMISADVLVSTWPNFLPSVKRSKRGKPRLPPLPLLFRVFSRLCLFPFVVCNPQ